MNGPGVLRDDNGGFGPVDSSRSAFELAAEPLKWVLLANVPPDLWRMTLPRIWLDGVQPRFTLVVVAAMPRCLRVC